MSFLCRVTDPATFGEWATPQLIGKNAEVIKTCEKKQGRIELMRRPEQKTDGEFVFEMAFLDVTWYYIIDGRTQWKQLEKLSSGLLTAADSERPMRTSEFWCSGMQKLGRFTKNGELLGTAPLPDHVCLCVAFASLCFASFIIQCNSTFKFKMFPK